MGRGRGRGLQARTSGIQGRVYAITPPAESTNHPVIQGTFLLSLIWARVLFDSGASHSFIVASVVVEFGLEVEALEEPMYVSSPLGTRARIWMIYRGCELKISGVLLTVDLRVMDMSEFDVILGMDWLTKHTKSLSSVSVEELQPTHRTVLGLRFRGTSMVFCPRLCTSLGITDN